MLSRVICQKVSSGIYIRQKLLLLGKTFFEFFSPFFEIFTKIGKKKFKQSSKYAVIECILVSLLESVTEKERKNVIVNN